MTRVTQPKGRGPKVLHQGPMYPLVARFFPDRVSLPATCLALMLWGAMSYGAWAQTPDLRSDAIFRADASEVRIAFSTTDQNNQVMATVQPSDFAIVDRDMVVRDFRSFARSEYTRLNIALLVDTSASITPQLYQELTNVVQMVARAQNVPDENFSIVSFRDLKPTVVCEANCRASSADASLPVLKSGGLTPLYDTIVFASHMLGRDMSGHDDARHARKILIVFSDGADTISLNSFSDALEGALNDDVAIYSVDVSSRPHGSQGTLVLRRFAINTGGRYFPIEAGGEKIVDAILEDFRATYTVAYKLPSHAAGFHQVRILPTHNLSLQFHCRLGYYYPSNPED
jgi:Ca-activated chloride channel homolog